jgi:hypothetical protein
MSVREGHGLSVTFQHETLIERAHGTQIGDRLGCVLDLIRLAGHQALDDLTYILAYPAQLSKSTQGIA